MELGCHGDHRCNHLAQRLAKGPLISGCRHGHYCDRRLALVTQISALQKLPLGGILGSLLAAGLLSLCIGNMALLA